MTSIDQRVMLQILSNPQGYGDETSREMRAKACDELQRLWQFEAMTQRIANELSSIINGQA